MFFRESERVAILYPGVAGLRSLTYVDLYVRDIDPIMR